MELSQLDVKVSVNCMENNRIDFEFFEKPTKNPRVILVDSAMSLAQKRTILTQECLRRLRNTKIALGVETQKIHLDKFMLKLKNSGYSQKFRTEILDSGLKAFQKMVDEDKSGIKPMYRSREWNKDERHSMKVKKKNQLVEYRKVKNSVQKCFVCDPHPRGGLSKTTSKTGGRTK